MTARFWTSGSSDRGGVLLQFRLVSCLVVFAVVGTMALTGNFIGDLLSPVVEELDSVVYAMNW